MAIKLNSPTLSVHNKFTLKLYDTDGKLLQEAEAYNAASARKYTMMSINRTFPGGTGFSYGLSRVNLGVGTGTIDIDTQDYLFTNAFALENLTWNRVSDFTFTNMHYRATATFPPTTSYVGELTEIGLGPDGSWRLMSHALLVDAENNPITVSKTSTNILIVTIDMFVTAKLVEQPFGFLYYPARASNLAGAGQDISGLLIARQTEQLPGTGGRIFLYSSQYCPEGSNGIANSCVADINESSGSSASNTSWTASVTTADSGQFPCKYTSLNNRIDADVTNFGFAHSVVFPGFGIIPLPNAAICPEYNYNGIAVGTGDGATTIFLPAVNEVVSAKIYVDGALTEATFQNFDPRKSPLWNKGIRVDYIKGTSICTSLPIPSVGVSGVKSSAISIPMSSQAAAGYTAYGQASQFAPAKYTGASNYNITRLGTEIVYYDEAGITLDHIRIGKHCHYTNISSSGYRKFITNTYTLSYSDDDVTWTEAITINTAYVTTYFTRITAKYWKLSGGTYGGGYPERSFYGYTSVPAQEVSSCADYDPKYIVAGNSAEFDFGKCGINFTTAPAAGTIITMDAVLNLPYKDTNTILICSYEAEVPDPGEAT